MSATSVCVSLAGVEVSHEERLVCRVTLMFGYFPHDVLDIGERVCLVQVWEIFEWRVLVEVLDNVGVEGRKVLVFGVWDWPVGAEQADFGVGV